MKTARFRYSYRDNASKLHKAIGDIIRGSSALCEHGVYQEYPVQKINPDYPHASHRFDWVITGLKVVVEVHGRQHFEPVAFDGDQVEAVTRFHRQKKRDNAKRNAACEAGWAYVWVSDELSEEALLAIIMRAVKEVTPQHELEKREPTQREIDQEKRHQEQLARAREYRKKRYQTLKNDKR